MGLAQKLAEIEAEAYGTDTTQGRAERYVLVTLDLADGSNDTPDPEKAADYVRDYVHSALWDGPGDDSLRDAMGDSARFTVSDAHYGEIIGAEDNFDATRVYRPGTSVVHIRQQEGHEGTAYTLTEPDGREVVIDETGDLYHRLAHIIDVAYGDAEPNLDEQPQPVWPVGDAERDTFIYWQQEVADGNTALGFRDWFLAQGGPRHGDVAVDVDDLTPDAEPDVPGVEVKVTRSDGADGAVVVFVDTEFEPDGSDGGPGLRVRVNDADVTETTAADFVAYQPAPELEARAERNLARFSAADADTLAGRTVTDDELRKIAKCLEFCGMDDAFSAVVETIAGLADDEDGTE
jgi:hypothetical protein